MIGFFIPTFCLYEKSQRKCFKNSEKIIIKKSFKYQVEFLCWIINIYLHCVHLLCVWSQTTVKMYFLNNFLNEFFNLGWISQIVQTGYWSFRNTSTIRGCHKRKNGFDYGVTVVDYGKMDFWSQWNFPHKAFRIKI